RIPGVVAVFTGENLVAAGVSAFPGPPFERPDGSPAASATRHALAVGYVRFVGEAVAAVVAETRAIAEEARDAIVADYETRPAVVDARQALEPGAPAAFDGASDNIAAMTRYGDRAAADAAFASAAHVVEQEIVNQRLAPSPLEPRTVLATPDPDSGRLTLRMSTQMPGGARDTLASLLGRAPESIRVLAGDVGGGFGMKTGLYPEDAVVGWCAQQLQRPIKWRAERSDEFLGAVHGRDLHSHAAIALDAQGRILALRIRSDANVGAYATPTGVAIPLLIGPWVQTSVYDIATIDFEFRAVLTNTTPTGAYRGAGRPEAIYLIERLIDAAAHRLSLDPVELRRRNLIRPAQMPYRNPMAQTYDSGNFKSMLEQGLALADWKGFDARLAASKARGRLRGRGVVTFLEWTGGNAL